MEKCLMGASNGVSKREPRLIGCGQNRIDVESTFEWRQRNVRFKCHSPIAIGELVAAFVISFRTHHHRRSDKLVQFERRVYTLPISFSFSFRHLLRSSPSYIVCLSYRLRLSYRPHSANECANIQTVLSNARPGSLHWLASLAFQPRPIYTVTNTFRYVQYVQCSNMAPATTTTTPRDIVLSRARVYFDETVKSRAMASSAIWITLPTPGRNVISINICTTTSQSPAKRVIAPQSSPPIDLAASCGHRMSKCFGRWSPIQKNSNARVTFPLSRSLNDCRILSKCTRNRVLSPIPNHK